ncbi:MAG: hypothetical protein Kow0077_10960 [Anaerolineae bacterium]
MATDTRKRKQMREIERKRRQQLYILIGIVVAAIAVLLVGILTTQRATQTAEMVAGVAESGVYAGIERYVDENGSYVLGDPDAPLTIADYSSFSCGHCFSFHEDQFPRLLDHVREGTVRFVYVPVAFDQYAASATVAAYCAGEQDKFWEMHDVLFSLFSQYSINAYTRARFDEAARALDLDMEAFDACLVSSEAMSSVDNFTGLMRQLAQEYPNVTGTPTITFNGEPPEWGSGAPQWAYFEEVISQAAG